jgi:CHAT domain-containing protein
VPDGVLHSVPFAVLRVPGAGQQYLIDSHEVVLLPSAAVSVALRRRAPQLGAARKQVAVFADPVFDPSDPRVRVAARPRAQLVAHEAQTASSDRDDVPMVRPDARGLPRLAYTRKLADDLLKDLAPQEGFKALDFAASRDAVARMDLTGYRMLMFATHGILDSEFPELSGIALSMVDEAGQPRDGLLRLQDIYHLRLDAELVVLAACETALGKQIPGEGVVGLARGFLYAGAGRAMASLWKVDEQATVALFEDLYRGVEKDGLSYAAALRAAQRRLAQRPRFRSPYYWAPFVLQGDWR